MRKVYSFNKEQTTPNESEIVMSRKIKDWPWFCEQLGLLRKYIEEHKTDPRIAMGYTASVGSLTAYLDLYYLPNALDKRRRKIDSDPDCGTCIADLRPSEIDILDALVKEAVGQLPGFTYVHDDLVCGRKGYVLTAPDSVCEDGSEDEY